MKSLRNSLIALMLLVFIGNANGFAQSVKDIKGAEDTQKELRDEAAKKKKEAQKVKDKVSSATSGASSVSQESANQIAKLKEKLKKTTNESERKALMDEIRRLSDGATEVAGNTAGDVRDDNSKPYESMKDEMREYKEKMKDATPEERKELEAKMHEMRKQKSEGKDVLKDEVKVVKEKAATEVKSYSDLKGREYGNARAADAKKMIEKKEADMANRDRFVASGKDRVSVAKARVQANLDSGEIDKEQAAAKLAKIAKAEQRLKDYEARVKNGKKKLADHKDVVSGYIKN